MAADSERKLAGSPVYPPRYFTGFVVLRLAGEREPVRVRFANAPWLPVSAKEAVIYPGTRLDPFYSARRHARRCPAGDCLEIQYAISVFDLRRGNVRIEKFNHVFQRPDLVQFQAEGDTLLLTAARGPLFAVYPLPEVMPGCRDRTVSVVQFIA